MRSPAKSRINPEPTINAWIEAHFSSFRSKDGGLDNRGRFAVVYAGVDYLLTANVLVGALVQFDWMKEKSNTLSSTVDGHGTMGGPYISLRLTPDIFFNSRFAWGMSNNTVNPFGYYTDAFSTDRWLAHAKLTGNWRWGDFRITPGIAADYAQERQRDYTDQPRFPHSRPNRLARPPVVQPGDRAPLRRCQRHRLRTHGLAHRTMGFREDRSDRAQRLARRQRPAPRQGAGRVAGARAERVLGADRRHL